MELSKQNFFTVQLSIANKPVEQYEIERQNDACNLCESRLCYKNINEIDVKYWKDLIHTGTAYYEFTKKSLENGMILDMQDNPYQPGFCDGSVTENKTEAIEELRKITQESFCPAILRSKFKKHSK
jgi:hypothetical protein